MHPFHFFIICWSRTNKVISWMHSLCHTTEYRLKKLYFTRIFKIVENFYYQNFNKFHYHFSYDFKKRGVNLENNFDLLYIFKKQTTKLSAFYLRTMFKFFLWRCETNRNYLWNFPTFNITLNVIFKIYNLLKNISGILMNLVKQFTLVV